MKLKLFSSSRCWIEVIWQLVIILAGIGCLIIVFAENPSMSLMLLLVMGSLIAICMGLWGIGFILTQSFVEVNSRCIVQKPYNRSSINWEEAKLRKSKYLGSLYVIYSHQKKIFIRPMLFSNEAEFWKTLAKHIPPERWETEYPSHYSEVSDEEKQNWPWTTSVRDKP